MDQIRAGVDKHSKLTAFENMLKAENAENLFPFPIRLTPFGKELATMLSAEEVQKINHDKSALLMGLQIIAGFLPPTVVDQVIQNQIESPFLRRGSVPPSSKEFLFRFLRAEGRWQGLQGLALVLGFVF